MKFLIFILLMSSQLSFSNVEQKCTPPSGKYTDIKMVLDQFVLNEGSPNWGDWCYEVNSAAENKECNNELDAWDAWLQCSGLTK